MNTRPAIDDLAVDVNYALAAVAERYGLAVSEQTLDALANRVRAEFLPETNPQPTGEPAVEAQVSDLAAALRAAGVEVGSVGGDAFRQVAARRMLPWLNDKFHDVYQQGRDSVGLMLAGPVDPVTGQRATVANPYPALGEDSARG